MRHLGIRIIIIFLIGSLCGCSMLYSYRNIERYIRWSLADYVEWDSAQQQQLHARLSAQLEWHRQTQLPRYRAWLEGIRDETQSTVDIAQLQRAADQLQLFWQDAMAHAAADIGAQLAMLSDKQVSDLIAAMHEKQADIKAEYAELTPAQAIKKRSRAMRKAVQYWLGPLEKNQQDLVDEWARQLPDGRARWLNSRERWTAAFEQALAHRHEPDMFAAAIQRLFVTPQE
ncbi:MAG TPA: DUF6279 family lipoprotein, partial [Spongiibacteraceae bacterium]